MTAGGLEMMTRQMALAAVAACVVIGATTSTTLTGPHQSPSGDRERFVGAWRLAWMEEPGPDGKLTRITDRKGTLMYTPDGRTSVQIQFPESQSSVSNDYILNGYEASFGTYEVNEEARTITRHVEGSITRGLVGKSLTRAYRFSDGRLTMRSVRPEERWSTTWERYRP
jgi:Lipocalin-like domain